MVVHRGRGLETHGVFKYCCRVTNAKGPRYRWPYNLYYMKLVAVGARANGHTEPNADVVPLSKHDAPIDRRGQLG